ncbi:MAG: SlyX family protein [Pseudomonadota bacterium]
MSDDERMTAAETKLAYLEDALDTLNDVVIAQRELIDALALRLERLSGELDAAAGADGNAGERPPHY